MHKFRTRKILKSKEHCTRTKEAKKIRTKSHRSVSGPGGAWIFGRNGQVGDSKISETVSTKRELDLEGLHQTNFCRRSNDFCRFAISLMKPSKSNPKPRKTQHKSKKDYFWWTKFSKTVFSHPRNPCIWILSQMANKAVVVTHIIWLISLLHMIVTL